jgi:hypothetical protein
VFDNGKVEYDISLPDIQRIYIRVLIQLREKYLLPKKIISIIWSNIVALLEKVQKFAQQRSIPLPHQSTMTQTTQSDERVIQCSVLTSIIRSIPFSIEATARSEYEFINVFRRFMDYQAPRPILLSTPGDQAKFGYFIPRGKKRNSGLLCTSRDFLGLLGISLYFSGLHWDFPGLLGTSRDFCLRPTSFVKNMSIGF